MEEWQKEILKGMQMLSKACLKQMEWAKCAKCPFNEMCTVLEENELEIPALWEIERR